MKSLSLRRPLRQAALFSLAAAALLCARGASAQALSGFTFQVTNGTMSGGDPVESVTDDLTFNNLVLTETFSDGFSTPIALGSLDTGTYYKEAGASLTDSTGGTLTSAVLTGTLGRDGFLPSNVLQVSLQQSLGGPLIDQFISSAFSTNLSFSPFSPFSTAPAGAISVGQFSLQSAGNPFLGSAPTEIIVAPAVPEASTVVSMGLMLALGLGGLAITRRRRAAK